VKESGNVFGVYSSTGIPSAQHVSVSDSSSSTFVFSLVNRHNRPFKLKHHTLGDDERGGAIICHRKLKLLRFPNAFCLMRSHGGRMSMVGANCVMPIGRQYVLDEAEGKLDFELDSTILSGVLERDENGETVFSCSEVEVFTLDLEEEVVGRVPARRSRRRRVAE